MTPEQKQGRINAARKAARFRWVPDNARKLREWMQMVRGLDPASGIVSWTKLDDNWRNNRKVIAAGPYGELIWLHAIGYANEWDLPGRVPKKVIRSLCFGFEARSKQAYEDAVLAGLLVDGTDDFEIHDFFKYQLTREEKEERRVAQAQSASAGGKARAARATRESGRFAPSSTQPIYKPPAETPATTSRTAGEDDQRPTSDTSPVPVPVPVPLPVLQESTNAYSLTRALHWLMHQNGSVIPDEPPREWLVEAERLFTEDQRDPREAVELLQWAMQDTFWAGAITNIGTFRRKYDQIRLQRQRPRKTTAGERAAAFGQRAEQLREQKRLGEEQQ